MKDYPILHLDTNESIGTELLSLFYISQSQYCNSYLKMSKTAPSLQFNGILLIILINTTLVFFCPCYWNN